MSDSLQPRGLQTPRLLGLWDSPGKDAGVGCPFLLQGIFLTQGSNLCLSLQADSVPLCHQGSPQVICIFRPIFMSYFIHMYYVYFAIFTQTEKGREKREGTPNSKIIYKSNVVPRKE